MKECADQSGKDGSCKAPESPFSKFRKLIIKPFADGFPDRLAGDIQGDVFGHRVLLCQDAMIVTHSRNRAIRLAGCPIRAEIGGVIGDALEPEGRLALIPLHLREVQNCNGSWDS